MAEAISIIVGMVESFCALKRADINSLQYYMPIDDKEQERLDITHTMILAARPKRYRYHLAPFEEGMEPVTYEPRRVLDLGCGTGMWLLDMARKYPHTRFEGVDLANMVPRYLLPNVDVNPRRDYENPWALGESSFDLVHMQMGLGSVRDWEKLYRRIFDHVKPGGWFEHVEIDWTPRSENGVFQTGGLWQWWKHVRDVYAGGIGRTIEYNENTGPLLAGAGFYVPPGEAGHVTFRLPMRGWSNVSKEEHAAGMWWETAMAFGPNHGHGMEALSLAALTHHNNWPPEHARRLCEDALAEAFSPQVHAYNVLHVWIAQKPISAPR